MIKIAVSKDDFMRVVKQCVADMPVEKKLEKLERLINYISDYQIEILEKNKKCKVCGKYSPKWLFKKCKDDKYSELEFDICPICRHKQ